MTLPEILLIVMVLLNASAVFLSIFYKGSDKRDGELKEISKLIHNNEKQYLIEYGKLKELINSNETEIKLLKQKHELNK